MIRLWYNIAMVPGDLKRFFWDVDPAGLDLMRHKAYIIERLLEFGDEKAVRWLFNAFSRDDIAAVLESSRSLSLKSRNFWRLRFSGSDPLLGEPILLQSGAVPALEDIGCKRSWEGRKR
jgi:hypothetical protein